MTEKKFFTTVTADIKKRGILWAYNYIEFLMEYKPTTLLKHGIETTDAIRIAQEALSEYISDISLAQLMLSK